MPEPAQEARPLSRFIQEARRRKLFRTAALYVIAAWVVVQVADLAFPGLRIAAEAILYVWIGALIGFPIALAFGWRYQVTAQGIRRTSRESESAAPVSLSRADYLILGVLALVAGVTAVELAGRVGQFRSTAAVVDAALSVAVLPLENLTSDPDQEYFAAGMHDALITNLAKISALRVISRSSVSVYRNVIQPLRQTASELGVGHVIEGSVFRTGNRVRINVQLIDALTDENVWSENYDRPIEDVLTLQAEVARDVAAQVSVQLTPSEETRLAASRSVDPETYESYLRGMYHLNQYTPEGVKLGMSYLQQAVDSDPDDPLAYAGLALGHTLVGHSANPPPGSWARAREAALRALELDSLFAEAHGALAEIRLYGEWDWQGAEESFRKALQLNPGLEFSHAHYGWLEQLRGDTPAAIEHMRTAQRVAPLTPIHTAWLGWIYWADGQLDKAVAQARRSLEINPNFIWGLHVLGSAYRAQERYEEALAVHERAVALVPNVGYWGLGMTRAAMGDVEGVREVIETLSAQPGQKDLVYLGILNGFLGDTDEAMRWLESAYEARVDWLPWIGGLNSIWASPALSADPRFEELVAKLDLPRAQSDP